LGDAQIELFLTYLAVERGVSAATQSIALNAIVFVKKKFLEETVGDLKAFSKSSRQRKLPVVLTTSEVSALLEQLSGRMKLMISLLYGSGLRRIELVRLRMRDIDFDLCQVQVRYGKGGKHRLVISAPELNTLLKQQIRSVGDLLAEDKENKQYKGVWLPDALVRNTPMLLTS
jgi:integrase